MLLSEVMEEITEKSPNYLSPESIVRKVNQVRNRLIRNYGEDVVPYRMDINEEQATYPWPYSLGSIMSVLVDGKQYPYGQMNSFGKYPYYYVLSKTIGLYPAPKRNIQGGLVVFHKKTVTPLSLNDVNADVGFDSDYDMLLVYGVLMDSTSGSESAEFNAKYEDLLSDYLRANTRPEPYQIQVGEW